MYKNLNPSGILLTSNNYQSIVKLVLSGSLLILIVILGSLAVEKVVSGDGGGETVGVLGTDKNWISRNGTNTLIL